MLLPSSASRYNRSNQPVGSPLAMYSAASSLARVRSGIWLSIMIRSRHDYWRSASLSRRRRRMADICTASRGGRGASRRRRLRRAQTSPHAVLSDESLKLPSGGDYFELADVAQTLVSAAPRLISAFVHWSVQDVCAGSQPGKLNSHKEEPSIFAIHC